MRERILAGALVLPFVLGLVGPVGSIGSFGPVGLDAGDPGDTSEVVTSFVDPEIIESSGLVEQDGLLITVNDSGDPGRVFAVDPATGETVGVTTWADDAVDVEAVAPAGDGEVWVGDIGDNMGFRDTIQVVRVPVGREDRTVDPVRYQLAFPDGPVDAETLLCDPTDGRLYVVTKDVLGGEVYRVPQPLSADRTNLLEPMGDVVAIATDGAFFPSGNRIILRDYFQAVVYTFPALQRVGSFQLPEQTLGEGIAVSRDDTVLLSGEGAGSDVLRVKIPDRIVAGPPPTTNQPDQAAAASEPMYLADPGRPRWPWFLTGWAVMGGLVLFLRFMYRR